MAPLSSLQNFFAGRDGGNTWLNWLWQVLLLDDFIVLCCLCFLKLTEESEFCISYLLVPLTPELYVFIDGIC